VPDKEHPAAKAGRYVRAAGIVIGKEMDRRNEAAAARAAAPKPVPAAPPPPPPPVPTKDLAGRAVFAGFVASIGALVLVLLHANDALKGEAKTIFLVILGAVLVVEAALLTTNWRQANQRIGQRLLTRVWGSRGPMNKRERAFSRLVRDALILIGICFLGGGVFALVTALVGG
jgi:hypothetical protein